MKHFDFRSRTSLFQLFQIHFLRSIVHLKFTKSFNVFQPDVGADEYTDYVKYLAEDEEIGAVVFDSDFKINLPKLYKASTYLKRPEVEFINGATDRVVPLQRGVLALGRSEPATKFKNPTYLPQLCILEEKKNEMTFF